MSAPLPMSVKLDDLPDVLKGNHLLAVKAWWSGKHFVIGVVDVAPKDEIGDADRK